jgi:hypothetical protein
MCVAQLAVRIRHKRVQVRAASRQSIRDGLGRGGRSPNGAWDNRPLDQSPVI